MTEWASKQFSRILTTLWGKKIKNAYSHLKVYLKKLAARFKVFFFNFKNSGFMILGTMESKQKKTGFNLSYGYEAIKATMCKNTAHIYFVAFRESQRNLFELNWLLDSQPTLLGTLFFSHIGFSEVTKNEWFTLLLKKEQTCTDSPWMLAKKLDFLACKFFSCIWPCWPRRLACATRGGVAMRSWPLLLATFSLFLSFFSVFCFWPTSGKHPCLKICFP